MAAVVLSERLQTLAEMVTSGRTVVDVGCDHGFVSIYLVQRGISPGVLAMDVRTGPLSRAKEHIAEYGLESYITTRLSDGLKEFKEGEAQSLVCAGMGGRLMTRILTDSRDKARGLQELILQPQSELPEFRRFLKSEGYRLLDENILCEDGKYYFLMKVCYCPEENVGVAGEITKVQTSACILEETEYSLEEKYGELLLQRKHPVLKQYLEETERNMQQIADNLSGNGNERAQNRLLEIRKELESIHRALALFHLENEQ